MQLTRETRGEMKIPCKNCHFVTKYSVSYIEDAINDGLQLTCSVCEEKFKVIVMPLDTIAVQQNAHQTGGEPAAKVGFLTLEEDAAIKADNTPAHTLVA